MVERLLFVIIMYSCHEIQTQAILPPKLMVNKPVITVTDSVTLSCEPPSSVSVSECHFYTVTGVSVRVFSCLETLTATELLMWSKQSSPAEVKVRCFYIHKLGDINSPSPHSDAASITVHIGPKPEMSLQHYHGDFVFFTCLLPGSANDTRCNLYFGEASDPVATTTIRSQRSSKNEGLCQFSVKIDDLLRHLHLLQQHDASCDYSFGSNPNSSSPRSDPYSLTDIVKDESPKVSMESAVTVTTDIVKDESPKVSMESAVTVTTNIMKNESSKVSMESAVTVTTDIVEVMPFKPQTEPTFTTSTAGPTVSTPHISTPTKQTTGPTTGSTGSFLTSSHASVKPATESHSWKLVACLGVAVGVVLLGLAFLCTKRGIERCCHKRKQASVTDDSMCMKNLDHGGSSLSGNDEAYSVITSIPGVDCPTGSGKMNRQESKQRDSDIYHLYATISEEPPPSALTDMVYSTVQLH